jgi:A/G-specific adenine glycosylase
MLQQTPVSRVESFYQRFLVRYPTLEALAAAPPARVRESWEGLGYYRRVANLQLLAQQVVREQGGLIPSDPVELRRLPGIGRYTAGAVASFAFEQAVPAVDTNVARVLRRVFNLRGSGRRLEPSLWNAAELLVPRGGKSAWAYNQAIMELGALVCTARAPRCPDCPVRKICGTEKRRSYATMAPAKRAMRPRVPAIEATIR